MSGPGASGWRSWLRCGLVAVGMLAMLAGCGASASVSVPEAFLFAYCRGNGEDGLHLLASVDGYQWQAVGGGKSFLPPTVGKERLLRDPCVARGPDGLYHMVWTCGFDENGIGYAATSDFVHWTAPRFLPVMAHEPAGRNVLAPELLFDAAQQHWVVFWSATIPGRLQPVPGTSGDLQGPRLYATTTRDWRTFAAVQRLVDPGFGTLDGTFVRRPDGQRFLLVLDDGCLRTLPAEGWLGPFGPPGTPFSPAAIDGPTPLWVGDHCLIYYDRGGDRGHGALRTRDCVTFEDVSAKIVLPAGVRHGSAFAVPLPLLGSLQR